MSKKLYFEILRIIAILLVMFNHTGIYGFFQFAIHEGFSRWVYMFISLFDKIAVPIFFMISGALLLPKKESIKELYMKRVFRFVTLIILASFCNYIAELCFTSFEKFNLFEFFTRVYSSNFVTAYWYLYGYLSFLIMLPILRKLAEVLEDIEYRYLILVHIVLWGVVPALQFLVWQGTVELNRDISVPIATSQVIFFTMIGYYIDCKVNINTVHIKQIIKLFAVSIIGLIAACLLTEYHIDITGKCDELVSQKFHTSFVALPAITVFVFIKWVFTTKIHIEGIASSVIVFFGSTTLGVMLLDEACRKAIFRYIQPLEWKIGMFGMAWVWVFSAFFMASAITAILKKIPGIRKLM